MAAAVLALPASASAFGTFASPVNYTVGDRPNDIVAGKFNDDATTDLLVAVYGENKLMFMKGNGDGTFTQAPFTAGINQLTAGDLDRDGDRDAVLTTGAAEGVSAMLNDGNGSFASPVTKSVSDYAADVVLGRFNRDRKLDAAVTVGGIGVALLRGRGNGTFRDPIYKQVGTNPNGLAAADLDRDGNLDVAVTDVLSGKVFVLRGRGTGRFKRPQGYAAGSATSQEVLIADVNGDRRRDLVVTHYGNSGVGVLRAKKHGGFRRVHNYDTDGGSLGLALADLNGTGAKDLAITDTSGVEILRGRPAGAFAAPQSYPTGGFAEAVAVGRFNADTGNDLAVVNYGDDNVSILLNQP